MLIVFCLVFVLRFNFKHSLVVSVLHDIHV